MAIPQERLTAFEQVPENAFFCQQEKEASQVFGEISALGIFTNLERANRLEPALRCANLAYNASLKLNELAATAGIDPLVSPKVSFLTGLLFKAGQGIDETIIDEHQLRNLDPHLLNLYKYPSYAPERTLDTSHVLKLSLLLHKLNHPWFAELILHGPHPQFFDQAELPSVLAALANANLAINDKGEWHSFLHPGVNLLAISPYAIWSDQLPPIDAKDWVDRAHMVAINTTLQHVFRIWVGINFTDEEYSFDLSEKLQRWQVVKDMFAQLGMPFPSTTDFLNQKRKNVLLKHWVQENQIIEKLQKKQNTSPFRLYDHSIMVGNLLTHLGQELDKIAESFGERAGFDIEYLRNLGHCHDCIKAFDKEKITELQNLYSYEAEFIHTYPPEVVARGNVSLLKSHDALLYAWLRQYEDQNIDRSKLGHQSKLADDFLSGHYHLLSPISALLTFADLAVINQDQKVVYQPDITERFLSTLKYISDPHTAIIGYAKLMAVAASLSWYLNIPLPKAGSTTCDKEHMEIMTPVIVNTKFDAKRSLSNISRVLRIFGVAVPPQLRTLSFP